MGKAPGASKSYDEGDDPSGYMGRGGEGRRQGKGGQFYQKYVPQARVLTLPTKPLNYPNEHAHNDDSPSPHSCIPDIGGTGGYSELPQYSKRSGGPISVVYQPPETNSQNGFNRDGGGDRGEGEGKILVPVRPSRLAPPPPPR